MTQEPESPPREPQFDASDRTVLVVAGGAVALAAGLGVAFFIMSHDHGSTKPPPASQGGLVVETARPKDEKLDMNRPLRCFVNGQMVGELTLADCAKRNGVATGALDVGLDETGALAATQNAGTVLTPLPPQPTQPVAAAPVTPNVAPTDTCWSHSPGGWRPIGEMSRNACVQMVFAGQCEGAGQALYARWGEQTLRLVTGRVEISSDNRRFQLLAPQGPNCSIAPVD
ncbi:MAG: hypothetical protein ACM3W4_02620 [Ignavibacteriales bacterium]